MPEQVASEIVIKFSTKGVQDVTSQVNSVKQAVASIKGSVDNAVSGVSETVKNGVEETTEVVEDGGKKVVKSSKSSGDDTKQKWQDVFARIKGACSESFKGITTFLSSLKRIAFYRAIRTIVSSITQAVKEGTKAFYEWSKAFGETAREKEFAKTYEQLSDSIALLKGSLGSMSGEFLNMISPALQTVINYVITLINWVNMLFARLQGKSSWVKCVQAVGSYDKAVGKATASTKKLISATMGIDELNILPQQHDNGGGSGTSTGGLSDYMYQEVAMTNEEMKKLDDIIDKIKFIGTLILGWKLASDIIRFMDFFGASKGTLKKAFGVALAITGVTFAFRGIKKVLEDGANWQTFVDGAIGGGAVALSAGMLGLPVSVSLMLGITVAGVTWGFDLGTWLTEQNWWDEHVVTPLSDYFYENSGVDIAFDIGGFLLGPIGGAVEDIEQAVTDICDSWDDITEFFHTWWQDICTWWKLNVEPTLNDLGDAFEETWDAVYEYWQTSWVDPISEDIDFFKRKWTDLKNFMKDWGASIKEFFQGIRDWWDAHITTPLGDFFYKVRTWWDDLKKKFEGGLKLPHLSWDSNGIETGGVIKKVLETLGLPTTIPKLNVEWYAEGGFPDQGQLFVARESGAELVGNIGGRTGVANNDQIVSGISQGVETANQGVINAIYELLNVVDGKNLSVNIGDKDIGYAYDRYTRRRGANVNRGTFADAY